MTATVMPKEQVDALKPEFVAPLIAVLAHESCPENGSLFEVAAGYICKDRWSRSNGVLLAPDMITPENVLSNWSKIVDFSNQTYPTTSEEFFGNIVTNLEKVMASNKAGVSSNKTAGGLKADDIFSMMSVFLGRGEGKELIPKVASVFSF
jgi:multifunctional beta-oxidation protein